MAGILFAERFGDVGIKNFLNLVEGITQIPGATGLHEGAGIVFRNIREE
ncbi:MAG: hypothetical protein AAFV54_07790 [Pseudomonadota bacterium]